MPPIIPIRDLKNTAEISERCHASREPIFVTKNGYGDMVIMSVEAYESSLWLQDALMKLEHAEAQVQEVKTMDSEHSIQRLREKYGV